MQSSEAWLTSFIHLRLALCNADHIIMSILFSLVYIFPCILFYVFSYVCFVVRHVWTVLCWIIAGYELMYCCCCSWINCGWTCTGSPDLEDNLDHPCQSLMKIIMATVTRVMNIEIWEGLKKAMKKCMMNMDLATEEMVIMDKAEGIIELGQ